MVPDDVRQLLKEEFALSPEQVTWGLKQTQGRPSYLPMILWQYGLIDIGQLDRLLDFWSQGLS